MSAAEPLPDPRIRGMTERDLDRVLTIERLSFTAPWSRRSFENLLRRDDTSLWAAVADDAVVGYAVVWYVAGEAELGNLAVAPEWRRRGLGARLLEFAVERAGERGVERIYLEVRVSNAAARELYEKHGFDQVGIRRRYYRSPVEDARVMCLELGGKA
jgi:ribosomal-protein-alanine N-acetyltransferase